MDFKRIVAASSYIEDRREQDVFFLETSEQAAERLLSWKKLLNVVPGKPIFETRLEQAGITEKEVLQLCGTPSLREQASLPDWIEPIQFLEAMLPTDAEQLWNRVALEKDKVELAGPFVALLPFVVYAEERILQSGHQVPVADLSWILLHRLYYACSQTFNAQARRAIALFQALLEEGDGVWAKLADRLLQGEWLSLFAEYPVLARRIGTIITYFLAYVEEFLDRFYEQKSLLEKEFFLGEPIQQLIGLKGEISDLHQKGKSVLILTLDGGRKLVYKPRSLEIDVAWEQFTRNFSTGKSSIAAPHALDCGHYGFIEYIEHLPCERESDIAIWYYNAGAMMALIHSIGGNDFHMENIIASGTSPVIVDTETLMIPVARFFGKGGQDQPSEVETEDNLVTILGRSVMHAGFLPLWQKNGEELRVDYGALTGEKEGMKNLPIFQGVKYPGNAYVEKITEGFRDMYREIMDRREELLTGETGVRLFQGCHFRMLIRNSQTYGNLLEHIHQPAFFKDGFDYSLKTERLVNAFLYEAHPDIVSDLLRVFGSERTAIERGDIPIFYCEPDGEGILDEEGLLFDRYFELSPQDHARKRIRELCEDDLKVQIQIIEKSLATEARNVHEYGIDTGAALTDTQDSEGIRTNSTDSTPLLGRDELLTEAREIFREIMENRFVAPNGDYSWLAEQYDLMRGGTSLNLMSASLYDGTLGLAVFFSGLYRLTDDQECKTAAKHCTQLAEDQLKQLIPHMDRYQLPLGYSNGISGFLRGLSLVSQYLNDEESWNLAQNLVLGITRNMIEKDTVLDVLGGVSGLVMTLTEDPRWLSDPLIQDHVKQLLLWCGQHLLSRRTVKLEQGGRVWESQSAHQPLTGLGHGAAGIAAALIRLHQVLHEDDLLTAAKDAITYEKSVFHPTAFNWPDFRKDPHQKEPEQEKFMAGYCSGAPGIGLARIDMLAHGSWDSEWEQELRQDVDRAQRFVQSLGKEQRNHLCCGSAGRVEFLIEASTKVVGDKPLTEQYRDEANVILSTLIRGKQQRGHYLFHVANGKYYYNPTLFQGTAGIGYEILRLLAPDQIRSVLL